MQEPTVDLNVPDDASHRAIINTLINGLERLTASFPWIAGQVIIEGATEDNTGISKIKPLERIPRLVVKDLRNDASIPTMDALRQAKFPMRMFDEDIICPCKTLPLPGSSDGFPVFLLQANFISGGLLLSLVGEHGAMDMTGQGQIIGLLSKVCRNGSLTDEEVSAGDLPRHNLIPLLEDSYEPGSELARQIMKPAGESAPPLPPAKSTWAYFTFSPTELAALKSRAMETVPSGHVSTDDALSALIWQSIMRIRLAV